MEQSGNSQGNPRKASLNLAKLAEDTDILTDIIRSKYGVSKVYLMGHSFGGAVGTHYLLDPSHQAKVYGWIDIDGAHNDALGWKLSIEWVKSRVRFKLAVWEKEDYWKKALDWYDTLSDSPPFFAD